jgi:small nuclear ribonucleoprotein (snRNP)-like protein
MRKIEQAMNTAILNYQNWRRDNTEVVYDSATVETTVKLHGNTIAVIGEGFV